MSIETAKKIISDNFYAKNSSFVYFLHEECYFSVEKFWEYYESVAALARLDISKKDLELTMHISCSYQSILQEMIFHFDPNDIAVMEKFPLNYTEFIERIDFAVRAYFLNDISLLEDEGFELQK